MNCPNCTGSTRSLTTRTNAAGQKTNRRECNHCQGRFTVYYDFGQPPTAGPVSFSTRGTNGGGRPAAERSKANGQPPAILTRVKPTGNGHCKPANRQRKRYLLTATLDRARIRAMDGAEADWSVLSKQQQILLSLFSQRVSEEL